MTGNLPAWIGAAGTYSNAYRMLERMAQNGHVTGARLGKRYVDAKGLSTREYIAHASEDMRDLIEALAEGDEERIKGLMINYRSRMDGAK